MKKITSEFKAFLKDESGQGATEYILLLVIVVGLAVIFKGKITEIINGKMAELTSKVDQLK